MGIVTLVIIKLIFLLHKSKNINVSTNPLLTNRHISYPHLTLFIFYFLEWFNNCELMFFKHFRSYHTVFTVKYRNASE